MYLPAERQFRAATGLTTMTRKVLLLGWDAADWKILSPLLDAGKMPNLQSLIDQGVMGNLATLQPVLSPMLWTSIATGKRAHKHGIHGFAEPVPGGGVRPITNLGRKTKAIWNILQQNGLKSNVVGWWPSFPAEPISGVMVSNHFQAANAPVDQPWPMPPGTVHPPRLAQALAEFRIHPGELEGEMLLPFVPRAAEIDQKKDRHLSNLGKILAENAGVHAAATALMQLEPWDFMAVYFDGIDHFCHGFMRYHPPRQEWVSEEDFELYKGVVEGGYRFHDLMLGTYLQLAGPDTTVMIVSDHGFHPDHLRPKEIPNEPAGPADEHREFGVFVLSGPGIKKDDLVFGASLLDITPTLLTLFGLPVGRDMDGRPLAGAFAEPPVLETVASWDEVPGDSGRHPEDTQLDPVDQAETMKQLVELGYIEKPDEDAGKAQAQTIKELKYNLARDYQDSQCLPQAIALFQELWDAWPDESRFGVHLFGCQLRLNRSAEARATLERVTREKTRYAAEARMELEKLNDEWKDRKPEDLSEDEQRRVMQVRKRAGFNLHTLAFLNGRLLAAEGRHEEALEAFTQAEDVQIHNRPSLYLMQTNSLMALKRWREAGERLKKTLAIDPVNAQAKLALAQLRLATGRPQKALEVALASLGLVQHNPLGHLLCARALARLKRYEEAMTALHTALKQNPVFPEAQRLLAKLYQRLGQTVKAGEHLALAKAARQRIRDFQAGKELPADMDLQADVDLSRRVSLTHLSVEGLLPPIGNETIVVSGLPRSGTSMMMQMLAAGGIPILTDGERQADESNPRGYLELEAVKQLGSPAAAQCLDDSAGKAVKIVAPLLPNLPLTRHYRVIFMERPLEEIIASQSTMLARQGRGKTKLSDRQLAVAYQKNVAGVGRLLAAHSSQVRVLVLDYHQALAKPAACASRINRFLGGGLNEATMAAVVDKSLYRERS